MKKLIFLLLILLTCTGCWNYKELTELGVISAMGISKKDDKYIVDLQLINIIEAGNSGITESPVIVISGEGDTIAEAIRSMNMKSSKVFFSSNIEYVIIDKSVQKNLKEVLDFLARDIKLSLNFLIVTSTDDSPKDILSALSQFNLSPASNISELIKRSEERNGASYSMTFKDFLGKYLAVGVTPVYPNIHLIGNEEKAEENETLEKSDSNIYVEIYNLVAFDKTGNLINLGEDESLGYNFLNNHVSNATITSSCGKNYFTIETLKTNVGFSELKDNKVTIKGDIQAEIFFYGCDYDLNKTDTLKKISNITEKKIKDSLKKTISLSKETKTDFIGVGNWLYKNYNDYFDLYKNNWEEEGLQNLEFDYDINVKLLKQGNLKGDI